MTKDTRLSLTPAAGEVAMLVLARKQGQKIFIGDDIVITIVETSSNKVRIGITAPKSVGAFREEFLGSRSTPETWMGPHPD